MKIYMVADDVSKEHLTAEVESKKSKYFKDLNVSIISAVNKICLTKYLLVFEDEINDFLLISKAACLTGEFNEVVICDRVTTSLEVICQLERSPVLSTLDYKIGNEETIYEDTKCIYACLTTKFPDIEVIGYTNYESPSEDEIGNQAKKLLDLFLANNHSVYDKYSLSSPESVANIFRDKIRLSKKESTIRTLEGKLAYADANLPESSGKDYIVGNSMAMRFLYRDIQHLRGTTARVLIRGERGTGKELVARAIYEDSPIGLLNKELEYYPVDCGGFPEDSIAIKSLLFGHVKGSYTDAKEDKKGIFEIVNHGTVFLDEIGNIPYDVQSMLLRYLETGEFYRHGDDSKRWRSAVRLICATNADLESMMDKGEFRRDFYDRISTVEIEVPPLSDRPEDIPVLSEHLIADKKILLENFGNDKIRFTISDDAKNALSNLKLDGNVRDLKNILIRTMLKARSHSNEITRRDIELSTGKEPSQGKRIEESDCLDAIEFLTQIQIIIDNYYKTKSKVTQDDIIKYFITKTGQKGFKHRTTFITDYLNPNKACIESLISKVNNPWKEVCQKCSFIRNIKVKKGKLTVR